jgi:hypothetical protein
LGRGDLLPCGSWLPSLLLGERERGRTMKKTMTYAERSKILKIELRRDEIIGLIWACNKAGMVGLAIDLEKLLEKELEKLLEKESE